MIVFYLRTKTVFFENNNSGELEFLWIQSLYATITDCHLTRQVLPRPTFLRWHQASQLRQQKDELSVRLETTVVLLTHENMILKDTVYQWLFLSLACRQLEQNNACNAFVSVLNFIEFCLSHLQQERQKIYTVFYSFVISVLCFDPLGRFRNRKGNQSINLSVLPPRLCESSD